MAKLIAITGGSGAGKTTIARALARQLGAGAAVIAEDDYYRDAAAIPDFDATRFNFDEPAAKDDVLLIGHLRNAKAGLAFDKPRYNLSTHRREAETEKMAPHDVVIVEGIHLLAFAALHDVFDLKVYVHADESVRLARRMIRDVETRARTPQAVYQQFFATVRPMHDLHVEPQRALADLVLVCPWEAGPHEAEANAALIAQRLEMLR